MMCQFWIELFIFFFIFIMSSASVQAVGLSCSPSTVVLSNEKKTGITKFMWFFVFAMLDAVMCDKFMLNAYQNSVSDVSSHSRTVRMIMYSKVLIKLIITSSHKLND